ncbi:hypothetical protein [Deinococcus pimensis]|uniref:hypothetical protein n=1 Tax=Deinococcus pimensis TaxID=309888 RepID=UPI000485C8E3|nr:hypothetical protein [Deinococcus pimensis]
MTAAHPQAIIMTDAQPVQPPRPTRLDQTEAALLIPTSMTPSVATPLSTQDVKRGNAGAAAGKVPLLALGLGLTAATVGGVLLWRRSRKTRAAKKPPSGRSDTAEREEGAQETPRVTLRVPAVSTDVTSGASPVRPVTLTPASPTGADTTVGVVPIHELVDDQDKRN